MSKKKPVEYVIGRKYHCDWAYNKKYVWRLIGYNTQDDLATLETPRTRKILVTKLSSLYDIDARLVENLDQNPRDNLVV